YVPLWFGPNFWITAIVATAFGFAVAAFVPMSAIFPTLEPRHKGAAVSIHNLSAGLSNFLGPAIATIVLMFGDALVTIWVYAAIYCIGFVLTFFMKVKQPSLQK